MSGAAAVKHKQKIYINKFQELGSLDADHSITLNEAGLKESYVFNRMVEKKIFIRTNNTKFYLNISAFESYKDKKQKLGFFILAALIIVLAFYYLIVIK